MTEMHACDDGYPESIPHAAWHACHVLGRLAAHGLGRVAGNNLLADGAAPSTSAAGAWRGADAEQET